MNQKVFFNCVARFMKDEEGATAIEYGLFAALISLLIIAGVQGIGLTLQGAFNQINTTLAGALPAAPAGS